ncbi:tripartite tricarboxylate transporter substrate binding protein [Ramlibacter sp. AW1]|uniref:Tripartite tricarboxylate transporter substrate binding protein n=1 Tax=Ramlibacter aurantiacus TaxID=2801330 RepID=A0A936ZIX1_9BURK|nr:tripartite tricarboxylate transporter substrate binding protein [Ramlibacter aurantiacus]MBL0420677.1 tripartite tricarboxylate transporter substrate binding protein [Ramlibacter aurantiacus]
MHQVSRRLLGAVLFAVAAVQAAPVWAQAYPSKPITVVVPAPAGGDTDALARLIGSKLSRRLGQPVAVDNRPGASGIIAATHVSRMPPDGHAFLLAPSTFSTAQLVVKGGSSAYDTLTGFTPVILTGEQPLVLVASSSSGIRTLKDLVAASRSGRSFFYASPGAGSPMHVLGELVNRSTGMKAGHVAYKGVAPAVNDVLSGQVPLTYVTIGPVAAHLTSGKLVALAVASPERTSLLPDVPTFRELGYPDIDVVAWSGLWAPKNLPAPIVKQLNAHINEILQMPDVVASMATIGATVVGGEPDALYKMNAQTHGTLGKVIKDLGIQAD